MNHRIITIVLALFILSGCATLPPLQEMSNARQTISAAKELSENAAADEKILEAERLLARAQRRARRQWRRSARPARRHPAAPAGRTRSSSSL